MHPRQLLRTAIGLAVAAATILATVTPSNAAVRAEPQLKSTERPNAALADAVRSALTSKQVASTPMVSGTLRDINAKPLANVPLRVDLEPTRNIISRTATRVGLEYIKVGQAQTGNDGAFSVQVPQLGDLSGYADDKGVVSALITSAGGQNSVWRRVYLKPPTTSTPRWTLSQPPAQRNQLTNPQALKLDGSGAPGPAPREDETSLRLEGYPSGQGVGPASIPNPAQYCTDGEGYFFAMTDIPIKKSMVHVRAHATGPDTTATYDWQTSANTEVDAAANIAAGGNLAKVGLTYTQKVSAGVNFSIGHFQPTHFLAQFEFRTWDLWCEDYVTLKKRLSGKFEWRPYRFSGGNDKAPFSSQGNCPDPDYTVPISSPVWVSRETAWSMYGGVDFGTVNLDSRQTNGTQWKLTVTPTKPAEICGLDDQPVDASFVMESY